MSDRSSDDNAPRPPAAGRPAANSADTLPGRRYVPPTHAPTQVAPGGPSLPPAQSTAARRDALGERDRGRVTINFSGPPLDLPGFPGTPPPVHPPRPAPLPAAPQPVSSAAGASAHDDDHDAWVSERKRRSTLPPMPGLVGPSSSTSRPPTASGGSLQHKWVSAHAAPLRKTPSTIDLPASVGDALTLADRGRPSESSIDLMAEVRARYTLDDLTGALQMAELVLGADESNSEAKRFASSCRQRLELLYTSQLGPLDAVPRVDVPDTDIRWLGLDHRAGFMLSRVDGLTTLDELLDLSGMERLEALKTVLSLVDAGAIRIPR